MVRKDIFRYRLITNLQCNMMPRCYFCYQPRKEDLILDIEKARKTMEKVGKLKRATIMGGESTLREDLPEIIALAKEYVTEDVCLVTNGILFDEEKVKAYKNAGLSEVAISISSLPMYLDRRDQAFMCKSHIPNTRINIPKCWESTGDKLVELLKVILTDEFYVIVCEDLNGRYGEFDFEEKLPAVKIKDDGYNFYDYLWNGHQFGVFGNYAGYDESDIIITPIGNFCKWEMYCDKVGNSNLKRIDAKN